MEKKENEQGKQTNTQEQNRVNNEKKGVNKGKKRKETKTSEELERRSDRRRKLDPATRKKAAEIKLLEGIRRKWQIKRGLRAGDEKWGGGTRLEMEIKIRERDQVKVSVATR